MKGKLIGILVATLLIATAIPAVGTINKINNKASSSTQNSGVEWTQTYGGDEYDVFYDVDVTDDGGYIMSGNHEENGNYLPYILKADSNGNEQWNWTLREFEFNGTLYDVIDNWAPAIIQSSDGKFIACIYILIDVEGEEILIGGLVKFDTSGNVEWFSYIGEEEVWWCIPVEIIENEIEEYFVITGFGAYNGDPENDWSALLVKTDLSGTIIDYEFYDYGTYQDQGYALCQTNDNGFLMTGPAYNTPGDCDYRMIKTDSNFDIETSNTFGRKSTDESFNNDCFQTEDGGYIMGGQSYESGKSIDAWIVRTDSDCNMIWNRSYGEKYSDTCWSMEMTDDDKYVICVTINFNGGTGDKEDTHLVKLDDDGKIEWIQINGGPDREVGISIKQTSDGGFIVAGRTGTSYSKDSDARLVKFAPFDNEQPDKPDKPSGKKTVKVGIDNTYKSSASDSDEDDVYYLWDWGDGNFSDLLGPYNSGDICEATYNWTVAGTYDIKVMTKDINGGESDWSDSLSVNVPRGRTTYNPFLLRLSESFPNAFLLLKYIFGFQ